MMERRMMIAVFAIAGFPLITQAAEDLPKDAKRPDVVLIVVDDLNDWIGAMKGHPQSLTQ